MITYHGVVAVNISVASSHSKKLSLRSFCHWGNFGSYENLPDIPLPSIGNKRRIRENFLHVWILCHHTKMFSHNSIHIWKSWVIMYDKYWSVCCLLSDHFFQGFQSRNLPCPVNSSLDDVRAVVVKLQVLVRSRSRSGPGQGPGQCSSLKQTQN